MVRIFLGRTAEGKRQYQNQTVRGTKSDAQKWLNDALTKKDLGVPTFQTKVSLCEYLSRWLDTVAKPRVSEQTFANYEWLLGRVITKLGKTRLSQLRGEDIQKFYGSQPTSTARDIHYCLRHTCASLLLQAGTHPKVVAERLGHSSTMLTLDVYSHVAPGMQSEATACIERMLYG